MNTGIRYRYTYQYIYTIYALVYIKAKNKVRPTTGLKKKINNYTS